MAFWKIIFKTKSLFLFSLVLLPNVFSQGLKLSLIINNYNYAAYLEEAIDSALAQSRLPDEIIVIDDGSQDASQSILKNKYQNNPCIKLIFQDNQGQAAALNKAYSYTTGDIIAFLDSDDCIEPGYIEKLLTVFEAYPHVTSTLCNCQHFGDETLIENPYPHEGDRGYQCILVSACWPKGAKTSCLAYRKKTLEAIFPLPYELLLPIKTAADAPLVIGAALFGSHCYYIETPFVRYRIHSSNDSKQRGPSSPLSLSFEGAFYKSLGYYLEKSYMPEGLGELAILEFLTNPNPTAWEYFVYRKVISKDYTLPRIAKRHYVNQLKEAYKEKTGQPPPLFIWEARKVPMPKWLSGT